MPTITETTGLTTEALEAVIEELRANDSPLVPGITVSNQRRIPVVDFYFPRLWGGPPRPPRCR